MVMNTMVAAVFVAGACLAQTVSIVNSGSTNTAGFRIVVEKSGNAEYTGQPRRFPIGRSETAKTIRKTIPKALAERLYSDVKAAQPLSALPERHCVKSVSFGTRLTIETKGDVSPDLSCGDGGNEKLKALIRDADEIVKMFEDSR